MPKPNHARLQRIIRIQPAKRLRRRKVERQADLHTPRTEEPGNFFHAVEVALVEDAGVSVDVVDDDGVDADRGEEAAVEGDAGEVGPDVADAVEEDGDAAIAALDGAVGAVLPEVVPLVCPSDGGYALFSTGKYLEGSVK